MLGRRSHIVVSRKVERMSSRENHQIEEIVHDLTQEFGERVGPKQVHDEVMRVYGRFSGSPIQQFVPVLTRRIAREELRRISLSPQPA